uniref:Uncharacterized protein n=1 Tax=Tetranychus urticae TaxID=32264 RepID=T1KYX2_TETUR
MKKCDFENCCCDNVYEVKEAEKLFGHILERNFLLVCDGCQRGYHDWATFQKHFVDGLNKSKIHKEKMYKVFDWASKLVVQHASVVFWKHLKERAMLWTVASTWKRTTLFSEGAGEETALIAAIGAGDGFIKKFDAGRNDLLISLVPYGKDITVAVIYCHCTKKLSGEDGGPDARGTIYEPVDAMILAGDLNIQNAYYRRGEKTKQTMQLCH